MGFQLANLIFATINFEPCCCLVMSAGAFNKDLIRHLRLVPSMPGICRDFAEEKSQSPHCSPALGRDVKFLKTSIALIAEIFHLDAKVEEILKKNLKISLSMLGSLLPNASGQVEFYTPAWDSWSYK